MIFQIDKRFEKDLRKQKDPALNKRFLKLIAQLDEINSADELPNIKKLAGFDNYYRIRLGDYRLGIEVEENTLVFIRCLHRKDIYKYFPK